MFIVIAAIAGLLIGSFLNVCIFRLPRDLSVVRPRSFCPFCKEMVAWYDNIPLVSFVVLRGECRHCHERIPWRYPAVEFATAISFAFCVVTFGATIEAAKYAVFCAIVIALIATDFEERILPDEFTLGGIAVGLAFAAVVLLNPGLAQVILPRSVNPRLASVAESAFGAVISSGALWLAGAIFQKIRKKDGLGLGDVKMVAMIGAFLGLQEALLAFFFASLLGSVGGLLYIFIKRKDAATYELPLGSFLGLAALAVAVFGPLVLRWYGRLGT